MSERTKKGLGATAVTSCVILHFYTGVRTFFENWYYTYTASSWIFLGLWLLCLLALDVWLYFFGGAELLRSLKWFWGFSSALAAGGLLVATLRLSLGRDSWNDLRVCDAAVSAHGFRLAAV